MIPASEYALRRTKILEKMEDASILILFGGEPKKSSADECYPFEINRNFYYLTGIDQEESVLILVKAYGEEKQYLFISPYDPKKEKWYGKKLTPAEAKERSGLRNVLLLSAFTAKLDDALNKERSVYGEINTVYLDLEDEQKVANGKTTEDYGRSIKAAYPGVNILDCYNMIVRQRMVKSENEIAELRAAIHTTMLGIESVMAMAKPNLKEYELADKFLQTVNDDSGYQGLAFPTIMAAGKNATCLHYPTPLSTIKSGDMVLMDLGSRNNYYCADVTRVIPVNGTFSEEQRTVYGIVLECNKAVANFARPGVTIAELQKFTKEFLANECLSKGFISEKSEIDNYYFHGISHHIGLDTHDPGDRNLPLEPGNVISDEPGLYMADRGIGVRIEDDLLITEKGCEVLSKSIIKEIKDIEAFYKGRTK